MAEMARPRSAPAPILQVRGLNVFYGHSHALQGVDLTLDHGVLSLVGRNGMGKTTLCKSVIGLVPAASGSIRLDGEEITRLAPAQIARLGIGYVPQGRRLWRSLTVDEHLRMTAGSRRGGWTVERIYELFPRLAERKRQFGGTMSGGEQQMLAIGRALMAKPQVLLLDEPSMGLAPKLVQQIFSIIQEINRRGTTVLLVEQNAQQALQIAHRAYVLETGEIVKSAPARDLLDDPEVRAAYLGGDRGAGVA